MIVTDVVDPNELTEFVRSLDPRAFLFTLDQFLPNQNRDEVEYAFTRIDQTRRDIASYRGFDVEADIGNRPGFARVKGQIPPISRKLPVGEELTLRLNQLRGQDATLATQIFDDAANLTEAVLGRVEYARGDVLFNGKVTFTNDAGFVAAQIDYTVGGLYPLTVLTAPGVLWSTPATATPIADMRVMVRDYMAANGGRRPGLTLTSDKVIQAVMACLEVRGYGSVGGTVPSFLTEPQFGQILTAAGLPPMVAYDTSVSVNGVVTRVTPQTKLVMLPTPNVANFGETTFGITAESMELIGSGFQTVQTAPGLTGVTLKVFDPVGTWTKVAGLVIPVLKDPAKIGTATVIA